MAIWIKENGTELDLNEEVETIKAAKANGWSLKSDKKQAKKPAKKAK